MWVKIIASAVALLLLSGCAAGKDTYTPPPPKPSDSASSSTPVPVPRTELLAVTDLPTGWTVDNKPADARSALPPCYTSAMSTKSAKSAASATFALGGVAPVFIESLGYFPGSKAAAKYASALRQLDACKRASYKIKTFTVKATIGVTSFPELGDASRAYTGNVSVGAAQGTLYMVVVRKGHQVAALSYDVAGKGAIAAFQALATAAITKMKNS